MMLTSLLCIANLPSQWGSNTRGEAPEHEIVMIFHGRVAKAVSLPAPLPVPAAVLNASFIRPPRFMCISPSHAPEIAAILVILPSWPHAPNEILFHTAAKLGKRADSLMSKMSQTRFECSVAHLMRRPVSQILRSLLNSWIADDN